MQRSNKAKLSKNAQRMAFAILPILAFHAMPSAFWAMP